MRLDEAYRTLGIEPGAMQSEVQAAYRELAQMLHPDRYATDEKLRCRAEAQFKRINVARDTIAAAGRFGGADSQEGSHSGVSRTPARGASADPREARPAGEHAPRTDLGDGSVGVARGFAGCGAVLVWTLMGLAVAAIVAVVLFLLLVGS